MMKTIESNATLLQLKLTQGIYSAEEAKDLVVKSLEHEKQFHKLRNYIKDFCLDTQCKQALSNLDRIEEANANIRELLKDVKQENGSVMIETFVRISAV